MIFLKEKSSIEDKTGKVTIMFMLGKVGDDNSEYVKPKKGEEVVVTIATPLTIK